MVDLNHLVLLAKVVEAGSFTAAARMLGVPKATLSRKIARLEAELEARLLHRTTRRLELTALGRRYHEEVSVALARLSSAEEEIFAKQTVPSGILRIAAPVDLGATQLMEWIPEFLAAYPKIDLELVLSDDYVDLIAERIDAAFRTGRLASSSLIARKLGIRRRVLVASRTYLERRGTPANVRELADHDAVVFGSSLRDAVWRLHGPGGNVSEVRVRGRIASNSAGAALRATVAGLGIALLPESLVAGEIASGSIRRVLPSYGVDGGGFYLVHPSVRHPSAALRAFLDFSAARIAKTSPRPRRPAAARRAPAR